MNYHQVDSDFHNDSTCETLNLSQQNSSDESSDMPVDESDSNVAPLDASQEPDRKSVTFFDLILLVISFVAHPLDYCFDIYLSIQYFLNPKMTSYGWLTILLMVLPGLTITWLSYLVYRQPLGKVKTSNKRQQAAETRLEKIAELEPAFGIVILFKLALPIRILRSFCFALRVRECKNEEDRDDRKDFSEKLNHEQKDVALLSIARCFLEVAPQLILQLYIFYTTENRGITVLVCFKVTVYCVALFILGWSLKTYHCNIRTAQLDKYRVKRISQIPLFIWYLCTVGSRIILFTIAFVMSPLYTSLVIVFICIGWTLWIYFKKHEIYDFCYDQTLNPYSGLPKTEPCTKFLFSTILSIIYLFIFVNLAETRTFYRYLVYYSLYTLEMVTVIALWAKFHCLTIERDWYSKEFVIFSAVLYSIGIVAMVIYYQFCHPTVWSVKNQSTNNVLSKRSSTCLSSSNKRAQGNCSLCHASMSARGDVNKNSQSSRNT